VNDHTRGELDEARLYLQYPYPGKPCGRDRIVDEARGQSHRYANRCRRLQAAGADDFKRGHLERFAHNKVQDMSQFSSYGTKRLKSTERQLLG
jgi:hypothetical protein